MNSSGEREVVQDTWESMDFCLSCQKDRQHQFILFVDEQVVESECRHCLSIREREDRGVGG